MTVQYDVMMGLVDRVVTGDDRWLGGRDGYMEDRDREVTVEVVMTKEAAGDTVVVLMRVIGGQEVQTQDVMEAGLAEETTSVVVVEIQMISADEMTEEMTEEDDKDSGDRRL